MLSDTVVHPTLGALSRLEERTNAIIGLVPGSYIASVYSSAISFSFGTSCIVLAFQVCQEDLEEPQGVQQVGPISNLLSLY